MRAMVRMRARKPSPFLALTMVASLLLLLFGPVPAEAKPLLDHFWCYKAAGHAVNAPVSLQDQFDGQPVNVQVGSPDRFCNPAKKVHNGVVTEILNPDHHLTFYTISPPNNQLWTVKVDNQFGLQKLAVGAAIYLAVPTYKVLPGHQPPVGLDHFKCYKAAGDPVEQPVTLKDQFLSGDVKVRVPVLFCNPTKKVHQGVGTPIQNPEAHLVCYLTEPAPPFQRIVPIKTQFGNDQLSLSSPDRLCVPSLKTEFAPASVGGHSGS